jgi:hypothetical protein
VTAPGGHVVTAVAAGTGLAMTAQANRTLARMKAMAPGTDAIRDRRPAAYEGLVR